MALVDFTTFDDIRAVLGVSEDELKDTVVSLDVYEFNLVFELEAIALNLATYYTTVAALPTLSRTAAQSRFYKSTRLFAPYAVAKQMLASLPMFGPKESTDGKAAVVRFATNPYTETIKTVKEQYEKFREHLSNAYAASQSTSAPTRTSIVWMAAASPSIDPVTGS